ncbi:MAG: hypothetical protein ACREX4_19625 [Gammaproteobacteria bacterium]
MKAPDSKRRLDEANIQLGKELWAIQSSLAIYRVIGLNAESIKSGSGKAFFGFVQNQSLGAVALGLGKVFEKEAAYELCSLSGVYRLAKQVQIQDIAAARTFVGKYGVRASEDWIKDVDQVFSAQRPRIRRHMQIIDRVRNTRLAHIEQDAPVSTLPSIAAFEELLAFAFEFHSFVNEAFLSVHSHPILDDRQIESSLLSLLKKTGVSDPVSQFKNI